MNVCCVDVMLLKCVFVNGCVDCVVIDCLCVLMLCGVKMLKVCFVCVMKFCDENCIFVCDRFGDGVKMMKSVVKDLR